MSANLLAQTSGLDDARRDMLIAAAAKDRARYARFLAEDMTSVDRAGWLRNKSAAVEDLPPGPQPSDADVRDFGGAAIVAVNYHPAGIHASIIQAWAEHDGQWQLVAQQAVTVGDGTVTPARERSAELPPDSGSETDRDAIRQTMGTMTAATKRGDAKAWGDVVSDKFVGTVEDGEFRSKNQRMTEIAAAGPGMSPVSRSISIRVREHLAVVNQRIAANDLAVRPPESWQTIILVRERDRWVVAALITTPITGAA